MECVDRCAPVMQRTVARCSRRRSLLRHRPRVSGLRDPGSPPARACVSRISQKPGHAYSNAARSFRRCPCCPCPARRFPDRQRRRRVPRPLTAHALRLAAPAAGAAELSYGTSRSRHVPAGSSRRLDPRTGAGRLPLQHDLEPAERRSAASVQPRAQRLTRHALGSVIFQSSSIKGDSPARLHRRSLDQEEGPRNWEERKNCSLR